MANKKIKKPFLVKIRNYFFAGAVVLVPLGITLYLTLFFIKISSRILPKEINPNYYLPFDIPGVEILISLIFITIVGLVVFGQKLDSAAIIGLTMIILGIAVIHLFSTTSSH